MRNWILGAALLLVTAPAQAQFVTSSLEQYSYQIGDASLEVRSYDGFDEFEDVALLPDFDQYDFRVDGGPWESIPFSTEFDAYKRGLFYPSLAAMLAARPESGTYEHRITRTDLSTSIVTLAGPRPTYASQIPNDPLFTISGVVGGTWSRNGGAVNTGVFTFDPDQFADGESFTVTMNAYAGPTTGAGQASAVFVADVSDTFTPLDEASLINVPAFGETDDVSVPITLTFTKGAGPLDAGDADPLTFRFTDGNFFELEGEHVNLLSLDDASAELGLAPDTAVKGFVYQTVTSMIIATNSNHVSGPSVPVLGVLGAPALAALLVGVGAALGRRAASEPAAADRKSV